MAKPHRKGPKPGAKARATFRVLITRTQYRVLDVEADNEQEAEDFALELAYEGDSEGWEDFECAAELRPQELPEPFRLDPDREKKVEKLKAPSGFQSQLAPLDDDEDD